ncbi:hypothetical protein Tco_0894753 [Tanacetum coccineum]|uniref:Uncharacterized protein n=1 Tax=Tanacetum coccineum TaxID=301880 RepID=A0ABQ5CCL4_9ASTR
MANQEQNPPQQEQPFVAAKQVGINLEDIILNTNNEEYLAEFWYSAKALKHSKVSFLIPIGGIYGEVGVNTFRYVIGAHYLPHSSEYVTPPSIDMVRKWFETIGYEETVSVKGTLKKSLLPPSGEDIIIKLNKKQREKVVPYTRFLSLLIMHKMKEGYGDSGVTLYPAQVFNVNNWALKPNQPEEPPFIDHIKEATKGRFSKALTGSKTGHLKKKKYSSSTMESNPSQTLVSTPVVIEIHKEDQPATGGLNSLGVTSEERADPQLSSGMSTFNLNKPICSASFIIHFESASRYDNSADSTAEADPGLSAPNDSIPQQQGIDEGTKNTSFDHIYASTDLHVLTNQTKSVSEGLETVITQPITRKRASSIARQVKEEKASRTIKLEDLAKLVSHVQPSFEDLDSPEDDPIIVVDGSDEDEEVDKYEVHTTINDETEDASVPKSSSPSSLPTELKELPFKFNKLTEEVKGLKKQVHNLEIELLRELKEISTKLKDFTKTVTIEVIQAELKTLDALPSLLHKVTNALYQFAQAIASNKTKNDRVSSAGQAGTQPAEGEKNRNQATISQLF